MRKKGPLTKKYIFRYKESCYIVTADNERGITCIFTDGMFLTKIEESRLNEKGFLKK